MIERNFGTSPLLGSGVDRDTVPAETNVLNNQDLTRDGTTTPDAVRALNAGASGLRKLTARTHLGNRRSETLLEKLGFKQEGVLRGHILRDGHIRL